jgi:hypothetical protein
MINYRPQIRYGENFSAQSRANEVIIVSAEEELKNTADFKKVKELMMRLIESGLTRMGEGYCISVSDIIFNMLQQNGIKCHLIEVQLSLLDKSSKENQVQMIGFHTTFQQNSHTRVSTHVVVVTDTEIPMLIDMSIAHKLTNGMQAILSKAENEGSKVVATVESKDLKLIYQEKKHGDIGIPQLHQISILDRISTDKKIFDTLDKLKILNYIGIALSSFALLNVVGKMIIDGW